MSLSQTGLILLADETISSSVIALEIDDVFTSDFLTYQIEILDLLPAIDQAIPFLRIGTGSAYDSNASDYDWNRIDASVSSFNAGDSTINLSDAVSNVAGEGATGLLRVYRPTDSSIKTRFSWHLGRQSASSIGNVIGSGQRNAAQADTSIRFSHSGGNTEGGIIKIYGVV